MKSIMIRYFTRERMLHQNKVFCVGFHKTGTSSLAEALRTLGYLVTGPNGVKDPNIANNVYTMAFALVNQYDAFQDNPWPIIYKDLDENFPGSKFILTLRDTDSWIKSQVRHFGSDETPMRKWIYGAGSPKGNESLYVNRFERHNREVVEYFKGRSEDFLILDFANGDGWEKLCSFLEKDQPKIPFPHTNTAIERERAKTFGGRLGRRIKNFQTRMRRHFI